jgi:Hydrolytic ATP binding site of dynein motor region
LLLIFVVDKLRYERDVLLRSICETMIPKLVADDIPLLQSLLLDVFPGAEFAPMMMEGLRAKINEVFTSLSLSPLSLSLSLLPLPSLSSISFSLSSILFI